MELPVLVEPYHHHVCGATTSSILSTLVSFRVCAAHDFVTAIKFADVVTVVGLITNGGIQKRGPRFYLPLFI